MKNWEKKEIVRDLRSKGLSYREISQNIPFLISKSTISSWCKDIKLTSRQLKRLNKLLLDGNYRGRILGSKITQQKREEEVGAIKASARLETKPLSENEFRIAGLMIYWAEGSKKRKVAISNSDPALIKFAVEWFRKVCGVSDKEFKVYLNLHSGQNETDIKKFWSGITGLSLSRFGKAYIKKEGTGHRKNILYKKLLIKK